MSKQRIQFKILATLVLLLKSVVPTIKIAAAYQIML